MPAPELHVYPNSREVFVCQDIDPQDLPEGFEVHGVRENSKQELIRACYGCTLGPQWG